MIWLRRIGIGIGAVILLALVVLYGGSQLVIGRSHAVPVTPFKAATDAFAIAEGGRIAHVASCRGCHGSEGKGQVFEDGAMIGHLAPPGLARKVAAYSDGELERLIRHGVKRDGTGVFIMPTENLAHLSDRDVAAVIGWLRTLKPAADDQVKPQSFGPVVRLAMLLGGFRPNVVAQAGAPSVRPAAGPYFVQVACLGCHRMHESHVAGDGSQTAPPLAAMAAAYDLPAFRRLLRTGKGMSPRDLGMMRAAAQDDLYALHDDEIAAIHAYLVAEAAKAPAQ